MPISIGIPFYNAEEFFADAIRSVFAQTYQEWELILVDDGSTDRSLEIAQSVTDPRVRVISDGRNRKLAFRLNQITAEAKYDFIGRMDADDVMSPTRFEEELAILAAHPEIDLVSTGLCSLTNDNRPVGTHCPGANTITDARDLLEPSRGGVLHPAILGRKSWFLRNQYDETLPLLQDAELWLRAFSKDDFKIYLIQKPLYYYRQEGNVTAEKLLPGYRIGRSQLRRYGYLGYGMFGKYRLIAKSHCKSLVVWFLAARKKLHKLLERRHVVIDENALLEHHQQEVRRIRQTNVPGLDRVQAFQGKRLNTMSTP